MLYMSSRGVCVFVFGLSFDRHMLIQWIIPQFDGIFHISSILIAFDIRYSVLDTAYDPTAGAFNWIAEAQGVSSYIIHRMIKDVCFIYSY